VYKFHSILGFTNAIKNDEKRFSNECLVGLPRDSLLVAKLDWYSMVFATCLLLSYAHFLPKNNL